MTFADSKHLTTEKALAEAEAIRDEAITKATLLGMRPLVSTFLH